MTTTCDYHNHSHAYTPCCCGHEYCEFYWKACPRCFGSGPQNRVETLTKLVKGKFTKGPYNIVWGNPVEIYDGDQLLAAIPHHPRGEHTPNACLFNEAPQMFADLNIFCKLLDEFYPENIYAGENFDEFVAVHAALRHAKATLLRANGGTDGTERNEAWWRARAEREEGHLIAAGALSMVPDAVKGEEVLVDPHDDLCDHGLHLEDSCAQCQSEMRAIDSLMEEQ